MKKNIKSIKTIILVFLALLTFSANAQIKDTILNTTLGRSSQQSVLKMVQQKNYPYTKTAETITCKDVEFAGYEWGKVVFYFYSQTLYKITFEDPYVLSEKNLNSWDRPTSRSDIFKSLMEAVESKYKNYKKFLDGYQDGTTKLDFGILVMTYENIPLSRKAAQRAANDL